MDKVELRRLQILPALFSSVIQDLGWSVEKRDAMENTQTAVYDFLENYLLPAIAEQTLIDDDEFRSSAQEIKAKYGLTEGTFLRLVLGQLVFQTSVFLVDGKIRLLALMAQEQLSALLETGNPKFLRI